MGASAKIPREAILTALAAVLARGRHRERQHETAVGRGSRAEDAAPVAHAKKPADGTAPMAAGPPPPAHAAGLMRGVAGMRRSLFKGDSACFSARPVACRRDVGRGLQGRGQHVLSGNITGILGVSMV